VESDNQVLSRSVRWTKTVDSALLILLLAASAYLIAFRYESGYLSWFGVPSEYAEVNVTRLIVAAGVALFSITMAALIWSSLKLLLARVSPLHSAVTNRLAYLVTWLVIALLLAYETEASVAGEILIYLLPILLLVGQLLMPLLTHPQQPSYASKLEASVLDDLAKKPQDPSAEFRAVVVRIAAPVNAAFLLVALLLTGLAHAAGARVARLQSEFLVANAEPPCAVLRAASRQLLCVSFDADKRVALHEFRFLKADETVVTLSSIGPLMPVETPPEQPEPPPTPQSGSSIRWHPVL
jgi:hypothetical protein